MKISIEEFMSKYYPGIGENSRDYYRIVYYLQHIRENIEEYKKHPDNVDLLFSGESIVTRTKFSKYLVILVKALIEEGFSEEEIGKINKLKFEDFYTGEEYDKEFFENIEELQETLSDSGGVRAGNLKVLTLAILLSWYGFSLTDILKMQYSDFNPENNTIKYKDKVVTLDEVTARLVIRVHKTESSEMIISELDGVPRTHENIRKGLQRIKPKNGKKIKLRKIAASGMFAAIWEQEKKCAEDESSFQIRKVFPDADRGIFVKYQEWKEYYKKQI